MEINGDDIPKWVGVAGVAGGFLYKLYRDHFRIQSHSVDLKNHAEKITEIEEEVEDLLSSKEHTQLCKDNISTVCKKLTDIQKEHKEDRIAIYQKVDDNRELVTSQFKEIAGFMGEIRGRNAMIDKERSLRNTDK